MRTVHVRAAVNCHAHHALLASCNTRRAHILVSSLRSLGADILVKPLLTPLLRFLWICDNGVMEFGPWHERDNGTVAKDNLT